MLISSVTWNSASGRAKDASDRAEDISGQAEGISPRAEGTSGRAKGTSGRAEDISGRAEDISGRAEDDLRCLICLSFDFDWVFQVQLRPTLLFLVTIKPIVGSATTEYFSLSLSNTKEQNAEITITDLLGRKLL